MKRRTTLIALVSSLAVLLTVLLTGCGTAAPNTDAAIGEKGYLTLSVNPEIRIEYNAEGLVTALEGRNNDGKAIVENFTDYIGKDCSTVLRQLVVDINEAGYFIEDVDGGKRQIVLQIEPGSALPDDDFLELLSRDVQDEVSKLDLTAPVSDIGTEDYDARYAKEGQPSPYITLDKAREIALAHAGVSADDVRWDDREFDFENGQPIFELNFDTNGLEYEYEVDAQTGKVLKAHRERDDDRPAAKSTESTKTTENTSAASSKTSTSGTDSYIGVEKAKSIALQKASVSASDVRWEKAELDRDDGRVSYELEFYANGLEYEYDIDVLTGKVLKAHRERDDDRPAATKTTESTKSAESTKTAYIGLEKAKSLALNKAGVSASAVRWEKAELDRDDGRAVYELEFRTDSAEYDVDVHAESGKILSYESERLERYDNDDRDDRYDNDRCDDDDDDDDDDRWDD